MRFLIHCLFIISAFSCKEKNKTADLATNEEPTVSLLILGTVQDAGSPHIACKKECCKELFQRPDPDRKVVALGLLDFENRKTYLFEATSDIATQLKDLKETATWNANELPDGIFITHAHIGHYSGLMFLGKEATNAEHMPVYAMPKMKVFLEQNGPWSQLVTTNNIALEDIRHDRKLTLTANISVTPFAVPHRDEYSETVGYKIIGPNKTALFIPDIDKWEKWNTNIKSAISEVDYAFLDATFFSGEEINNRDISTIPHPFVIESMKLFRELPKTEKAKIHFIHLNHTNPLLNKNSKQTKEVLTKGFQIAYRNQVFQL